MDFGKRKSKEHYPNKFKHFFSSLMHFTYLLGSFKDMVKKIKASNYLKMMSKANQNIIDIVEF